MVARQSANWTFICGSPFSTPDGVSLHAGGNPVAYLRTTAPIAPLLQSAATITAVWRFDAPSQSWRIWSPTLPAALQGFHEFIPGEVYWIVSANDSSLSFDRDVAPPPPPPPPPPAGTGIVFTAGGDHGSTSRSTATFEAIAESDAQFHLALGDLSYNDITPESAWCDYVHDLLGETFPVQLLAGNHESDTGPDGHISNFVECLPDRMNSTGAYGAEYYFDVQGLVRIIMISAGDRVDSVEYDYEAGSSRYEWLSDAIDDARAAEIPWVIVGMHKLCYSAGNKGCSVGQDLMDLLFDKRVDLILQAHDHDYQRSKQLICARVDEFVPACVVDDGSDGEYARGEGSVLVINGAMGGGSITGIDPSDSEFPYFAETMGADHPQAGRGFLEIELSANELRADFVSATSTYSDHFVIR